MKKKVIKGIAFFIIILFFISISINIFATGDIEKYKGTTPSAGKDEVEKMIGTVLSAVRIAGAGISIIILAVISIKYMLSSSDGKADIKQYTVPYFVGALIFLGATQILGMLRDLATSIS